jgi:ABC-type Na+ transport system ATPase subunit NatA
MGNFADEITNLNEKIASIKAEFNSIGVLEARVELLKNLTVFDEIDFASLNDYQVNQILAKLEEIKNIANTP